MLEIEKTEIICSLEAEIKIKEVQKRLLLSQLILNKSFCSIGYIEDGIVHLSNLINLKSIKVGS